MKILQKTILFFKNKYRFTLLLFVIWMLFFDSNNFYELYKLRKNLYQLKKEKAFYSEEILKVRKEKEELFSDTKNLEKFAREKYLMKKDNEDLFVIVGDDPKDK